MLRPGPPDGRYLVRSKDGEELAVVGIKTLGARPKSLFSGRARTRRVTDTDTEPDSVPVARLTVVPAEPLAGPDAAGEWLSAAKSDADHEIDVALRMANRIVHAHRLATADPYVAELKRASALKIRIGFGSGDQVAEGHWTEALSVPVEGKQKRSALDPESRLVDMLSGRSAAHAGDDLVLRAKLDLDQGRVEQARLQAQAAAKAFQTEGVDQASEWSKQLVEAPEAELLELVEAMLRIAKRRMHLA